MLLYGLSPEDPEPYTHVLDATPSMQPQILDHVVALLEEAMTVHVLDESPNTDAAFGTSPDDRTLSNGWLPALSSWTSLRDRPPTNWQHGPVICLVWTGLATGAHWTLLLRVFSP